MSRRTGRRGWGPRAAHNAPPRQYATPAPFFQIDGASPQTQARLDAARQRSARKGAQTRRWQRWTKEHPT